LDNELLRQVLEYIRTTGELLVSKGYEIVSKQVVVECIWSSIIILISISLLVLGIILLNKAMPRTSDDAGGIVILSLMFMVLSGILFFVHMPRVINALVNPDWMAIQLILNSVK
jgi:hypothetical protein